MRRLLGRWVAIVALIAGVGVGATAVPASADTPSSTGTSTTAAAHKGVQPADWWY